MNGKYIQALAEEEFAEKIKPFAPKEARKNDLLKVAPLVKSRMKKLSDFSALSGPLFERPKPPSRKLARGINKKHLSVAYDTLKDLEEWRREEIDKAVLESIDKNKFKTGDFFMSLRIAQFSSNATPSINDSIVFLGKSEVLERINRALNVKGKA